MSWDFRLLFISIAGTPVCLMRIEESHHASSL
jgi:hypothetical protein